MLGPLADQDLSITLHDQGCHHLSHRIFDRILYRILGCWRRTSAGRGLVVDDYSSSGCLSRYSPTSAAQLSTSARSARLKAAGTWLSISSSPTTFPCTKTGATISDLVSREQAR